ncbi:MAG: DUF5995 family protein [Myxococcota bacterium]|nr:DUF5995 family protein [Myxococcota bacterium]
MFLLVLWACADKENEPAMDMVAENDVGAIESTIEPEEPTSEAEDSSDVTDDEVEDESPESEEEEETIEETVEETYSCVDGRAYWQECTGIPLPPSIECTQGLYTELELVQALSCETFLEAQDGLPLCESMGVNCPEDIQTCAAVPLDAADYLTILEWTDTTTLTDVYDVADRNAGLRFLFAERGDIRGAFSSVYSPITDTAVESIDAGTFEHDAWVRDLVIAFSARYYENLRASLLSQPTTQSWGRYYHLADDCSVNGLRVAAHGIVVHLIVDLPHTLVDIASTPEQKDDFDLFGLVLVETTPMIVENLRNDYGIESENFFSGFFLGNWIDSVAGDDATTTFAFQTIRNKAWKNGMWLQDWRFGLAESDIYLSWRAADVALASWDIFQ